MAIYGARDESWQPSGNGGGLDPFASARARLAAQIAREQSQRPDLPQLDELVIEISELEPLPAVATRILSLAEDQRFSAHELAAVIASDQAVTARLLRLANSAYYGVPRRIGSVRDAVVLLGFRAVQQVALASCLIARPARLVNLDYEEFWRFSITTGLLAELLAHTERAHEETAFTAGVMHNIGLLALDQHRPEVLREVLARARSRTETLYQAERGLLGYTDADLGSALAAHWNFPAELVEALREVARTLDAPPAAGSLAATVARARIFARSYGVSDGLRDRGESTEAPSWAAEPFAEPLDRAGGLDRLLAQAGTFLQASIS